MAAVSHEARFPPIWMSYPLGLVMPIGRRAYTVIAVD